MTNISLSALVAVGLLAGGLVTSANAADLGGNCCADLEERIAELEATTARKGNRKVSLTISGWVGQQISFWDDGVESNTYIHDLGSTLGSHVKFTGSAQISPGYSAGYVLQIEAISSDSLTINADRPVGPAALVGTTSGVQVLQSYWFVKSDQLGKISVGKQSQASDNTAILVDGSGSLVPANWVAFDVNSFAIRRTDGVASGLIWGGGYCGGQGGAWGDCNGLTRNVVRYDSPTFGGFSVSASWGEDDMWDIAGRYAGEHHGFKLAVAAAYNEWSDQVQTGVSGDFIGAFPLTSGGDNQYFQLGVYVQHVATGLFALYNYGHNEIDNIVVLALPGLSSTGESDTHYFKAGLRTKWNHLGATIFYGEYLNAKGEDALSQSDLSMLLSPGCNPFGAGAFSTCGANEDETEVWGLGVVQEVDAAAMSVWIKYRHMSYSDNALTSIGPGPDLAVGYEDFQYVGVGGLINF